MMRPIAAVGVDPRPLSVLDADVEAFDEVDSEAVRAEFEGFAGIILPITARADLRAACDMEDGLASRVGAIDTILYQPMGTSRMVIGYNATAAAIARAIAQELGVHPGGTGVITGSGPVAASAVAALVQLRAERIILASEPGPGIALGAAHRMEVDVEAVRPEALTGLEADILVSTATFAPGVTARASLRLTPDGLIDDDVARARESELARLYLATLRSAQLRALTGVTPQLADILSAL